MNWAVWFFVPEYYLYENASTIACGLPGLLPYVILLNMVLRLVELVRALATRRNATVTGVIVEGNSRVVVRAAEAEFLVPVQPLATPDVRVLSGCTSTWCKRNCDNATPVKGPLIEHVAPPCRVRGFTWVKIPEKRMQWLSVAAATQFAEFGVPTMRLEPNQTFERMRNDFLRDY